MTQRPSPLHWPPGQQEAGGRAGGPRHFQPMYPACPACPRRYVGITRVCRPASLLIKSVQGPASCRFENKAGTRPWILGVTGCSWLDSGEIQGPGPDLFRTWPSFFASLCFLFDCRRRLSATLTLRGEVHPQAEEELRSIMAELVVRSALPRSPSLAPCCTKM